MAISLHADQLATPSALAEAGREAVADGLRRLVADLFALYVKTKNYYWHMSGRHFRDYPLLLDERADQVFAAIDPVAERGRKLAFRRCTPWAKSAGCSGWPTTRRRM